MRLVIDRSLCDGNGLCVAEAPDHLRLDENDELQIDRADVDDADLAAARRAVGVCPKAALSLKET